MSVVRRTTASLLLVMGSLGAGANSVQADHVADLIGADGGICRLGGLASGIGVDLRTTEVRMRVMKDDLTKTFICTFYEVPGYVSATESQLGREWFRPSRAYVGNVACWRPEFQGREHGDGHFVITPHGPATLTCRF